MGDGQCNDRRLGRDEHSCEGVHHNKDGRSKIEFRRSPIHSVEFPSPVLEERTREEKSSRGAMVALYRGRVAGESLGTVIRELSTYV